MPGKNSTHKNKLFNRIQGKHINIYCITNVFLILYCNLCEKVNYTKLQRNKINNYLSILHSIFISETKNN